MAPIVYESSGSEQESKGKQPPHPKTLGRQLALQFLYMYETRETKEPPTFDEFMLNQERKLSGQAVEFARKLATATLEHKDELDAEIAGAGSNWKPERMARIERNLIRMGLAELQLDPETPFKVVLNEAIELAKRYANEDSGAFVNGVLDSIRKKLDQ